MSDRTAIIACDAWVSVDDLAKGLDWVHWLLGSVRARCDGIVFVAPADQPEAIMQAWVAYVESAFRPVIGPLIVNAWQAAVAGLHENLRTVDGELDRQLDGLAAGRSRRAGAILLRGTRGARHQGVLGHYRAEVDAGLAAGHFAAVWPVAAHFFQLGLANVLAEYLRIEWELGAAANRTLTSDPQGRHGIAGLVSQVLHSSSLESRLMSGG